MAHVYLTMFNSKFISILMLNLQIELEILNSVTYQFQS